MLSGQRNWIPVRQSDAYSVLGVTRNATNADIKRRFQELTVQHHPDNHPKDTMYYDITRAYTLLKDEASRQKYDIEHTNKKIQVSIVSPYKSVIGVGVARNIPNSLRSVMVGASLPYIPPTFGGVTCLLISVESIIEGVVCGTLSIFDFIGLGGYGLIGWAVKPRIASIKNGYVINGIFSGDVEVSQGVCTSGEEVVCKIENGVVSGCFNGSASVDGGWKRSGSITVESGNVGMTVFTFFGIKIGFCYQDGFVVGFMINVKGMGINWVKTMFNMIDPALILTAITEFLR
ncbi:hypothetical protein EIN_051770 [Entamoeba invadens IP1]|uniref:hypothetical protein n=1 Tax=Entamoeba invadens IP1 TaxID=370355 RepID=UPI0002C3E850|nr:hypothetical protein EIN_051770 [Entamoeba invadens IP1]ELP93002.1 hypothetical protein EIN_051770 [Entamoeba invadens IP1]|eukprot:XP_004259773.1 hypothetical protein EIN_051770 [Entamoeba invadens IP1]